MEGNSSQAPEEPEETTPKQVELTVDPEKDDGNILSRIDVEDTEGLFDDDDHDEGLSDICNISSLKIASVNEIVKKREVKDHDKHVQLAHQKTSFGRTFKERQQLKLKRKKTSKKLILTKKQLFTNISQKTSHGSRNVGGHPPHDKEAYDAIESIDYSTPDTVHETEFLKSQSHTDRRWRGFFLWVLYGSFGIIISLVITYTLLLCDIILNWRVQLTATALSSQDIGGAWLAWVGTSMLLCLGAAFCVLVEPAAASSGIPGLWPILTVLHQRLENLYNRKNTDFLSYQTMGAKLVGMIFRFHQDFVLAQKGRLFIYQLCWQMGWESAARS